MEQIEFNLLFRWFVGLGMDDPVWDASTFCHNRDRLLEAALELIDRHCPGKRRRTLGADKAYDVTAFVDDLRRRKVTPHVAVQDHLSKTGKRRKTRIDGRATRHPGYAVGQRIRKRIEEIFGWVKIPSGQAKTKFRGRRRVDASFTLSLAAYNLIRLPRLLAEGMP